MVVFILYLYLFDSICAYSTYLRSFVIISVLLYRERTFISEYNKVIRRLKADESEHTRLKGLPARDSSSSSVVPLLNHRQPSENSDGHRAALTFMHRTPRMTHHNGGEVPLLLI